MYEDAIAHQAIKTIQMYFQKGYQSELIDVILDTPLLFVRLCMCDLPECVEYVCKHPNINNATFKTITNKQGTKVFIHFFNFFLLLYFFFLLAKKYKNMFC